MRLILFLALLLLPSIAQAQASSSDCLVENHVGRITGKIAYDSFVHPFQNTLHEGYKIILLKPKCFDFVSVSSGQDSHIEVTEIQINLADNNFLKANIGKLIAVTGRMENYIVNVITWPQIDADSYTLCQDSPASKASTKC